MRTFAVLPVKSFSDAKRRLRSELVPSARRSLAEAMFCDVLVALRRAQRVHHIIVVSADHSAQQIAAGYGTSVVADDEWGHNTAASLGVRTAVDAGAERALLVPGDCPALDAAELDALLDRETGSPSVLIVPDRHGTGTNALLLCPPKALAPSFGPDSCRRHLVQARDADTDAEVVEVPSLALDVDTADDLEALQSALAFSHGAAGHTRGMLAQLLRSRA